AGAVLAELRRHHRHPADRADRRAVFVVEHRRAYSRISTRTEGGDVAIAKAAMTDEQRKSVSLEYLKAFDKRGATSSGGGSLLDLFADDAQVFFPKGGLATGKEQIGRLFADCAGPIQAILHDYATFNWIMTGSDVFACEGTSAGVHRDGEWRAGVTHAGRWC